MTTLKNAIEDLLNNRQLTAAEAVDRHFGPDFRQRTNGTWADRATFLARIDHFRDVVAHATITVLDELGEADRYAEHHVIDLLERDGGRIRQEVYLFATRDPDGRFARIEETTLLLEQQQEMPGST